MKPARVLTSLSFRFMLLYVVGLSVAVFLVMVSIYGVFTYSYFQDLQAAIVDELDTLTVVYQGQGVAGVEQYISDQQVDEGAGRFSYLLADASFNKIAGTLDAWPPYREFGDGWVAFGLGASELTEEASGLGLLARPQVLADGSHLLAALRYSDILESNRLVRQTLLRTMLATLVLGVFGGYLSAAVTVRRIEGINQGIDDIVHGDLSQRIPLGDAVGNIRQLIQNFNHMLDQTESLMQGVRTVSNNIAHDLRTPLTHMRNNLSLLQAELAGGEEERVQQLIEECDGILITFNALLRIEQLEAGERMSEFAPVELSALVQDVVELYEPLAQDKNIALRVQCESRQVQGDRDLLFQMMANLLDNAVKYTPAAGCIAVSVSADEPGGTLVTVADSGPGIPFADRENVFRRFFRLESSRGVQAGNGLGLSLVRAVINIHQGGIDLSDNQPGLVVKLHLV